MSMLQKGTTTTSMTMTTSKTVPQKFIQGQNPKVAIIGAGAAGLVTARILSSNGFRPYIFEKEENKEIDNNANTNTSLNSGIGGVWSYQSKSKTKPMYKGLRTNLPRELMAFREKKWGGDGKSMSFVTHGEVQDYLSEYTAEHHLDKYISFGSQVKQLTVFKNEDSGNDSGNVNDNESSDDHALPKVEIEWESSNNESQKDTFDAVCICNGHYAAPSSPPISGIEHFKGKIMHSIEYDDPSIFQNQTVLCIGGRASGSDLAREISEHAKKVYLSDTSCPISDDGLPIVEDNVLWVPKTMSISEEKEGGGRIHFDKSCTECPNDVDVIILCSGYDYQFPFINDKSNLDLDVIPGERRVSPLFEQLWHAQYPNIAFIGLQHSVVPFPFFELQAEAIARQWNMKNDNEDDNEMMKIPSLEKRMKAAKLDANSGGPKEEGRVQDTHFLGSYQWDACRKYAQYGGVLSDSVEKYIATNKAIYNHSNESRKRLFPGGPDEYRYNSYVRDDENKSFFSYPVSKEAAVSLSLTSDEKVLI